MKKSLALGITLILGFSILPISQASAKTFKNCTALNKVYPGGVALPLITSRTQSHLHHDQTYLTARLEPFGHLGID